MDGIHEIRIQSYVGLYWLAHIKFNQSYIAKSPIEDMSKNLYTAISNSKSKVTLNYRRLCNDWGLFARRPRHLPLLSEKNVKDRMTFAKEHRHKDKKFFDRYLIHFSSPLKI